MWSDSDLHFMQRALSLAEKAQGHTAPNPMVGCVLVKGGQIIGEGFHPKAGMPHAEVVALEQAGEAARGAIAYVTLEPCAHFGRTPPCAEALVKAGVAEVVVAVEDPFPKVQGRGRARLEAAGIHVREGCLREEATYLNRAFFHRVLTGKPYVTLKVAMSLDGKIATQTGQSQWITSGIARQKVQALRKMCDGILVGTQTLFVDRPRLTVHNGSEDDQPTRCFLDRKGRVPMDYFARAAELPGRKIVLHGQNLDPQRMQSLGEMGFETNQVPEEEGGFVLDRLLTQVADCGINHLLVEGGARLVNQLISQDLIQEIWLMIAPIVLAGQAPTWSGLPFGVNELSSAPRFQFKSSERLGSDLAILLERSL